MIIVLAFVVCAVIGWRRAARQGGTRGDRVQYALAHGIPGALVGLALTLFVVQMGWVG